MPQHHAPDFLVSISADIVEGVLALHLQSELRRLMFSLPLAFRQAHPFADNRTLCFSSKHGDPLRLYQLAIFAPRDLIQTADDFTRTLDRFLVFPDLR
jgi:hypothetical protein